MYNKKYLFGLSPDPPELQKASEFPEKKLLLSFAMLMR